MSKSCGIDFGTSNSALALVTPQQEIELAFLEDQHITLPSALFYPKDGSEVFGRKAIQSFIGGEEGRFMRSLKRILGTSLMEGGTVVNGRNRAFEDILKDFLSYMKQRGESQSGHMLENVVLGRPVHFVDHDPAGDKRAEDQLSRVARSCGFKHIEFQYEPIAAAFFHERKISKERLALVADLGGGTSDFTVIRLCPSRRNLPDRSRDILSNSGIRLGGNDFDKSACLKTVMPVMGSESHWEEMDKVHPMPGLPFFEMSEWAKINFLYTPKFRSEMRSLYAKCLDKKKFSRFMNTLEKEIGHEVLSYVEEAKILLSGRDRASMTLHAVEAGLDVDISREEFDKMVRDHVVRLKSAILETLRRAQIKAEDIELVILTGGTTEIPVVQKEIQGLFRNAEFSEEARLSSVGLGLGYDSQRRFG